MLKGIRPELNGDILQALSNMGHGDYLVVSDTNFPSDSVARHSLIGRLLTMENTSAPKAIEAILSVFPLDTPLQPSVGRMEVIGRPDEIPDVQRKCRRRRSRGRQARADVSDRAHGLLRHRPQGLLRDRDRRNALLRLLHPDQGRHSG